MKISFKCKLISVISIIGLSIIFATLTSCANLKQPRLYNSNWLVENANWKRNNFFRNPYKIHLEFARQLDDVLNFNELKKRLPKPMQNVKSFTEWSQKITQLIKDDVNNVAMLEGIQKMRKRKATVLVLENRDELVNNKENYNKFSILTPPDLPLIYSNPFTEVPGLGLNFPEPINEDVKDVIDRYQSIGHSALRTNPLESVLKQISSFYKTADYVFYMYDSNLFTSNKYKNNYRNRHQLFKKITSHKDFYPHKLLRNRYSKIIFIDRSLFWWGSFAMVGQSLIIKELLRIFANKEFSKIKWNYKPFDKSELINLFDHKPSIQERNSIIKSHYINENTTLDYGYKIVGTWADSIDHLISFGLKPDAIVDYASFNNISLKTQGLSNYLKKFVDYDKLEKTYKTPNDSEKSEFINKDFAIYAGAAYLLNSINKLIVIKNAGSWAIGTTQGINDPKTQFKTRINIAKSNL